MKSLTKKSSALSSSYATLKNKVRETLLQGQQRIEREKVRTYWETGRLINQHIIENTPPEKERAAYNKKIVETLSNDLKIDETVLYRCVRFTQSFKKVAGGQLSWSHYRQLMTIPDEKKRLELATLAENKKWSAEDLTREFKKIKIIDVLSSEKTTKPLVLLKPIRGSLYTYRLRLDPIIQSAEPALRVDLGFSCYKELNTKGLAEGDIVESLPRASAPRSSAQIDSYILKKSTKTTTELFTFKAYIERVVDGDTLIAQVDLGFSLWTRQYLRLRGIDVPEMDTAEGKKAKRFVEKELENVTHVIISSSKSDKYDRYLADVFYFNPRAGGDLQEKYLNNELLTKRLAVRM